MENGVSRKTMIRLVLIVLSIALVCTAAVQFYNGQYRQVVAQERSRLQMIQRQVTAELRLRLVALEVLAGDEGIWALAGQQANSELKRPQQQLGFGRITIYRQNGAILAETQPAPDSQRHDEDRQYVDLVLKNGKSMITDLRNGRDGGFFSCLAPVFDGQQRVKGVIIADMPVRALGEWLSQAQTQTDPAVHLFLRDERGQFLYHPIDVLARSEQAAMWLMQDQSLALHPSVDDMLLVRHVEEERLYLYAYLENAPWHLVLATTMQRVYLQVFWQSIYQVVFFLLLIGSLILMYRYLQQGQRHEEDLRRMRLERLLSVNQMAAGLAHEIRNPLTSITGFVQLMMRQPEAPQEQKERMQLILDEVRRLDRLVGEFQQLTKPLEDPRFIRLDLGRLAADVLILMGPQSSANGVKIRWRPMGMPSGAPVYMDVDDARSARLRCDVIGDEGQLKQVVMNLVKNAIEAAEPDGQVEVAVGTQEGMAALLVRDNGPGMTPDVVARLGTPFFTTKDGGNGLGLSICYTIVANHGGRVVVKSLPGRGATFIVLLPLADR